MESDATSIASQAQRISPGAREDNLRSLAYWLTLAAAMSPLVSIAASNILLVAALLVTLIVYRRLDMPRSLTLPLLLFVAGTMVALVFSPNPRAGWPQLKQLYVFSSLPLIYTVLRRRAGVERLLIGWAILASASALWSFVQLSRKTQHAIDRGLAFEQYYRAYVGERPTGFMSHWMTFAGEQMIVVIVLAAALLFGALRTRRKLLWLAVGAIGVSIGISFTRSVWLGTAIAAVYLMASWRPRLLLLLPVLGAIGWFTAPRAVRERAISVYRPHGTVDSNEHRRIVTKAGITMVKASPWVGIGPGIVQLEFHKYLPAEIPLPLPDGFYGHLHNVYLQYAAERGIPTLLAFLWFIAAMLATLLRWAFRMPAGNSLGRAMAHGSVAVTMAVLIEALFEVNLGDSEVLRMFLAVIASSYAVMQPDV
jgi:putative inorganic carbon (hco3(-)) transporter